MGNGWQLLINEGWPDACGLKCACLKHRMEDKPGKLIARNAALRGLVSSLWALRSTVNTGK